MSLKSVKKYSPGNKLKPRVGMFWLASGVPANSEFMCLKEGHTHCKMVSRSPRGKIPTRKRKKEWVFTLWITAVFF